MGYYKKDMERIINGMREVVDGNARTAEAAEAAAYWLKLLIDFIEQRGLIYDFFSFKRQHDHAKVGG